MSNTDPAGRIAELCTAILAANDAYATDTPSMLDADYDDLCAQLAELLDAHPHLTPMRNPLEEMWQPAAIGRPVRHARPMLSLAKVPPDQRDAGVAAFMLDTFPGVAVIVAAKIDGVSGAVLYRDGVLERVATRGDGTEGEDVTAIVTAITRGVPATIDIAGVVEVRGELAMTRSAMAAYNATGPKRTLMNPRNAAAGVLSLKHPADAAGRELVFAAFDLDVDGAGRADEQLADRLAALGFTPATMSVCSSVHGALAAIAAIEELRGSGDLDIDGAVLRVADVGVYERAGTRSKTVRGAVAVKFAPVEGTTTLLDVVWPVGPGGKLPPRAVLDPVLLAGTTISSATLSTPKVVADRGLRSGCG